MFRRLMVPLDGSKAAENALPYAEEIAAKFGSEIVLVSVSESAATDTGHLHHTYLERTAEQVECQLKDWEAKKETVVVKALVGKPAVEILRYADENSVNLIAMASRGLSGEGPWPLGSIAVKIIRATARPVLLIRAQASELALQQKRLLKRILVPLDGSKLGETAVPGTEILARVLGAELVLLQVVEPATTWGAYDSYPSYHTPVNIEGRKASAKAYLDGVGKPLKEKGLNTSTVVEYGLPASQIIEYAKANGVDLIAMSTHGRSGIALWVFGSVTDKVLHTGDMALLIVRASKL